MSPFVCIHVPIAVDSTTTIARESSCNGFRFVHTQAPMLISPSFLEHHRFVPSVTNRLQPPSQAQSPAPQPSPPTSTPNTTSPKTSAPSSARAQPNAPSTRTPPAEASRSGTNSKPKCTACRPTQKPSGAARAATPGPRRMRMRAAMASSCCSRACSPASWSLCI